MNSKGQHLSIITLSGRSPGVHSGYGICPFSSMVGMVGQQLTVPKPAPTSKAFLESSLDINENNVVL